MNLVAPKSPAPALQVQMFKCFLSPYYHQPIMPSLGDWPPKAECFLSVYKSIESGQLEVPLDGILEGYRVRPPHTKGLGKMFWFAVSPGRIRSGSNVLDAKCLASFGKYPCDVGGPVIRHRLTAIDTLTV